MTEDEARAIRDRLHALEARTKKLEARRFAFTAEEAKASADQMFEAIRGFVRRAIDAAFEQKGLNYEGTWQMTRTYRKGQFVTYSGSVWHARCETVQRPGDGGDWQLAVKRGADAK